MLRLSIVYVQIVDGMDIVLEMTTIMQWTGRERRTYPCVGPGRWVLVGSYDRSLDRILRGQKEERFKKIRLIIVKSANEAVQVQKVYPHSEFF